MRKNFRNRFMRTFAFLSFGIVLSLWAYDQIGGQASARQETVPPWQVVPALSPYIDVHSHANAGDRDAVLAETAAKAMQLQNIAGMVFMPPPAEELEGAFDAETIAPAVRKYPGKFWFNGGGGTLNPMIFESVRTGNVSPEFQRKFRERAEEIARMGARGFGEISGPRLPRGSGKWVQPPMDHPLYLILADVAAEHNMVIDLHMEAIPQTFSFPTGSDWAKLDPLPDPPVLTEAISGFERLLRHNRRAKIVWGHASWDHTGQWTVELSRRLLGAHPNLFMSIKCDSQDYGLNPYMVDVQKGPIKPEWLQLIKEFPDRFVIGSDQGYPLREGGPMPRWQTTVLFFNQLPADLRQKIGLDNPTRIYGLK
jgi:hypothetical protein